jgi:hypothetical protein
VGLLRRAEAGWRIGVGFAEDRGADEADIAGEKVGQPDSGNAFLVWRLLDGGASHVTPADRVVGEVEVSVGEYASDH